MSGSAPEQSLVSASTRPRTDAAAQARVDAWIGDGTGDDDEPGAGFTRRYGPTVLTAIAALAMTGWRLGRPALWLDEAASVVATQRTWPALFRLLHGADAPLVPYYVLLKLATGAVIAVSPSASSHPEVLYRWPSALAIAVAATVLIAWLSRFCPTPLVLSTAAMLLLTGGLSRYGQEARPYALVLLLAVLCTVQWARMVGRPRIGCLLLYAVTFTLLVALNDLAASLLVAHAVAAVVAVQPGRRRRALRRTITGAALGLLIAAPLIATAVLNGRGASRYPSLTPVHLAAAFLRLFVPTGQPLLGIGPIVLLALVGLTQVGPERHRFIARLSAAWALVPPTLLLPAVAVRPNLLIGRYLLFTVPAWTVLAGLGLVTLADLARRALARLPGLPARAALAGGGVLGVLLLAGTAAAQAPTLGQIRTPAGHGEDIRPALATADRGPNALLPILVDSRAGAIEVPAYDRADDHRLIGLTAQRTRTTIWPTLAPYPVRTRMLSRDPRILLLLRNATITPCLRSHARAVVVAQVAHCMPALLRQLHYQVLTSDPDGAGWTISVLTRPDQAS